MWDTLVRPIHDHLPLWLLLWPMLGAVIVGVARQVGAEAVRRTMQVNLCLSVALSVWLVVAYEPLKPVDSAEQAALLGPIERFQFRDSFEWVGETKTALLERTRRNGDRQVVEVPIRWGPDIRCEVGVDGISIWFVALSVLLVAIAASGEWRVGSGEPNLPDSALRTPHSPLPWLWLQASLVGTFVALDVVLIVVCWMSTLLAVAWLMGQAGDSQRHDVTPRLLKRGWWGGWLVLLGLGGLVLAFGWLRPFPNRVETPLVFSIPELMAGIRQSSMSGESALLWASVNNWLFWLLVVGFTGPLWLAPFHRGFVEAFASAPRGLAIVLAGVLLKVGVYGWLRFILPLFPELVRQHGDGFTTLLGLSSLFAAVLAFGVSDWRRRIALATCSSISLSLLGMTTLTLEGLTGGVLRLLSHGLTAGLLMWLLPSRSGEWLVASGEQDKSNATPVFSNSPLATHHSPLISARWRVGLMRFALFAWIGLPGLGGFVAEFVTPFGLFQHDFNAAALSLATSGVIAWMWVRAERDSPDWSHAGWSPRDTFVAAVLVTLNIGLGVAPQFVVDRVQPSLLSLLPMDREISATSSGTPPVAEVR